MTLDERAARAEQINGGIAYLVVLQPDGSVSVDRTHPDGSNSGIGYGAQTFEAGLIRRTIERFQQSSSYEGQW